MAQRAHFPQATVPASVGVHHFARAAEEQSVPSAGCWDFFDCVTHLPLLRCSATRSETSLCAPEGLLSSVHVRPTRRSSSLARLSAPAALGAPSPRESFRQSPNRSMSPTIPGGCCPVCSRRPSRPASWAISLVSIQRRYHRTPFSCSMLILRADFAMSASSRFCCFRSPV